MARPDAHVEKRAIVGSFDWALPLQDNRNIRKAGANRASYDRALASVADYRLTDGRRFGHCRLRASLRALWISLRKTESRQDGKTRLRSALLSMTVFKLAWSDRTGRIRRSCRRESVRWVGNRIRAQEKPTCDIGGVEGFVAAADADGSLARYRGHDGLLWMPREEDIFQRVAGRIIAGQTRSRFVLAPEKPKDREDLRSAFRCGRHSVLAGDGRAA